MFDPDHFFSEFDDEEQGVKNLVELFREIQRRGLTKLLVKFPKNEMGTLIEPYLSAYKTAARQGGDITPRAN
jgi:Iap family predicted aminopeptidase